MDWVLWSNTRVLILSSYSKKYVSYGGIEYNLKTNDFHKFLFFFFIELHEYI